MQKLKNKIVLVFIAALVLCVLVVSPLSATAEDGKVYLGGMPAGFTLGIGGAQVVGICDVLTENGVQSPAKQAEVCVGDIIVNFGGVRIESAADMDGVLASFSGGEVQITVERGVEKIKTQIFPAKDMELYDKFHILAQGVMVISTGSNGHIFFK